MQSEACNILSRLNYSFLIVVTQSIYRAVSVSITTDRTGVGGVTIVHTVGLGYNCIVLVTQSVNSDSLAADLSVTNRTVNDIVVRTSVLAISSNGVLNDGLTSGVTQCIHRSGYTADLSGTNSTVNNCVVGTSVDAICGNFILDNRITVSVTQSVNSDGLTAQLFLTNSTVNDIVVRTIVDAVSGNFILDNDLTCGVTGCVHSSGGTAQFDLTNGTIGNCIVGAFGLTTSSGVVLNNRLALSVTQSLNCNSIAAQFSLTYSTVNNIVIRTVVDAISGYFVLNNSVACSMTGCTQLHISGVATIVTVLILSPTDAGAAGSLCGLVNQVGVVVQNLITSAGNRALDCVTVDAANHSVVGAFCCTSTRHYILSLCITIFVRNHQLAVSILNQHIVRLLARRVNSQCTSERTVTSCIVQFILTYIRIASLVEVNFTVKSGIYNQLRIGRRISGLAISHQNTAIVAVLDRRIHHCLILQGHCSIVNSDITTQNTGTGDIAAVNFCTIQNQVGFACSINVTSAITIAIVHLTGYSHFCISTGNIDITAATIGLAIINVARNGSFTGNANVTASGLSKSAIDVASNFNTTTSIDIDITAGSGSIAIINRTICIHRTTVIYKQVRTASLRNTIVDLNSAVYGQGRAGVGINVTAIRINGLTAVNICGALEVCSRVRTSSTVQEHICAHIGCFAVANNGICQCQFTVATQENITTAVSLTAHHSTSVQGCFLDNDQVAAIFVGIAILNQLATREIAIIQMQVGNIGVNATAQRYLGVLFVVDCSTANEGTIFNRRVTGTYDVGITTHRIIGCSAVSTAGCSTILNLTAGNRNGATRSTQIHITTDTCSTALDQATIHIEGALVLNIEVTSVGASTILNSTTIQVEGTVCSNCNVTATVTECGITVFHSTIIHIQCTGRNHNGSTVLAGSYRLGESDHHIFAPDVNRGVTTCARNSCHILVTS